MAPAIVSISRHCGNEPERLNGLHLDPVYFCLPFLSRFRNIAGLIIGCANVITPRGMACRGFAGRWSSTTDRAGNSDHDDRKTRGTCVLNILGRWPIVLALGEMAYLLALADIARVQRGNAIDSPRTYA